MAKVAKVARFLGWFSIGLGASQVVAPGGMAQLIGVGDGKRSRLAMRAVGLREITAGIGILTNRRPAGWLWARVAGDAMDLALLGQTLNNGLIARERVVASMAAVLGITATDLGSSLQISRDTNENSRDAKENSAVKVKKAITINSTPEELYNFWHNFENLPRFMRHLESVKVPGPNLSHWKAKAPAGKTVEWDAQTVEDRPNELISWRSLENADIQNSGTVRFTQAPGGRGTQVHVEMSYDPPGGKVGSLVAKVFGEEPEVQVIDSLHNLKQIIEVGEIVVSDGTIDGTGVVQHPAQPAEQPVAS